MQNREGCTGATDSKRNQGKALAAYRVFQDGALEYYAVQMDADQKAERRRYMRKMLLNYPEWGNLPNEELDKIRLMNIGDAYLVEDSEGRSFALRPNRVVREESEFRKACAMIPFEFIDATAKSFLWDKYNSDTTESVNMMNKYLLNYQKFKDKGMGLYIYSGTKGSGKTMLACCLLNEIANRYIGSAKFVNVLDFIEMTKKSFDGADEEVNAIYQAGILVLDDIGVQMAREWVDTVLYRLVNSRYVNKLPTIYTSNLSVESLKIDDRVVDRIESTTYTIELPNESIRRDMRQQEKQMLLDEIRNGI